MFRKLTTQVRKTAQRWSARPFWAASLGALLTMLIVSGPLACFVHCAVVGETHAAHQHAHHVHNVVATVASPDLNSHALLLVNQHGDHALCDYLLGQSSNIAPDALTIGVVLTTSFALQIAVVSVRRLDLKPHLRLIALPPPLKPPRLLQA